MSRGLAPCRVVCYSSWTPWGRMVSRSWGAARCCRVWAVRYWTRVCSANVAWSLPLLRTQTSAGDRTDLLGRGSVAGAWARRSNPRYTSLLPPFWKKGSSCPSAWKGVCGNDLKPAARVSFRVKLWCGRRGVRVQGEWGGRGKQASVCVAPVWVWVCYECCGACGRIRAIRASVSLKREKKESGVLCSRSWMKLFYSGSAKRF